MKAGKPSFEARMMSIQGKPASMIVGSVKFYSLGFKEARNKAAAIAVEADARITALEAQLEEMAGALEALDYWFDTDEDVLLAMTPDVRADHKRQHGKIIAALTTYRKTQEGGE